MKFRPIDVGGIHALREYSTDVGRPRVGHPMKVYNVKLMDESRPATDFRPIYVSGIGNLDFPKEGNHSGGNLDSLLTLFLFSV